jgi:hypothetical protein
MCIHCLGHPPHPLSTTFKRSWLAAVPSVMGVQHLKLLATAALRWPASAMPTRTEDAMCPGDTDEWLSANELGLL